LRLLALSALALAVACAPRTPRALAERGVPLAITGVTLIDVNAGTTRPGMTVLVRDGRIASIGGSETASVPPDAQVVDASGKYLIPGLWDAHVHLSFAGPEILPLFVAHGVTTVRDAGSRFDSTRAMRVRIDTGDLVGPRILTSGPVLEGAAWMEAAYKIVPPENPVWKAAPRVVASRDNIPRIVDSLKAVGVDLIKSRNVWGDDFLALAAATERAGIPLAAHNPNRVNMADAARGGLDSFEHAESVWGDFDTMTVAARARMFEEVARTGALVTPTLMADIGLTVSTDSVIEAVLADSLGVIDRRNRSLPRAMRQVWRLAMEQRRQYGAPPAGTWEKITRDVRAMHRAGITMMAGTDIGGIPRVYPGSSLHEELELLVREGGLTPLQALQSATRNPPRFFRQRPTVVPHPDPLAVGAVADLVLLDADPLADIANVRRIRTVVLRGRLFDRAALDALVAGAELASRAP
jgi:imidazolonepropionase-like amidohydrolase